MSEKKLTQDKGLPGFILKRAALVLLDALIMNGSYYLALLIRFFDRPTGVNDTTARIA